MLAIATLATSTSFADVIRITKSGGGQFGYDKITEQHGSGTHTLDCRRKGYEKCEWTTAPLNLPGFFEKLAVIEGAIASGIYNGTQNFEGGITAIWHGTGPYDVEIEITY